MFCDEKEASAQRGPLFFRAQGCCQQRCRHVRPKRGIKSPAAIFAGARTRAYQPVNKLTELRNGTERLQDLFVAGSFRIVRFDKLPAHHAGFVDHVGRGVGPAFSVRIQYAVAVDHLVALVLEHRKIKITGKRLQFLGELFRLRMGVDADGQDLDPFVFLRREQCFQLPELKRAVGSPIAAVKDQHHGFFAAKTAEGNPLPICIP